MGTVFKPPPKQEAVDRLRGFVRPIDRLRLVGVIKTEKVRGSVRITEAEIERFITKHTAKKAVN